VRFWRNAWIEAWQSNQFTASGMATLNYSELDSSPSSGNRMTFSASLWSGQHHSGVL